MKKTLVSLVAALATVGVVSGVYAGECNGSGCKAKKYRVIRISAPEPGPDAVYSEQKITESKGTVVTEYPEYRPEDFEYEDYEETVKVASKRESSDSSSKSYEKSYKDAYVGGRVSLHLVSWKNKYKGSPNNYEFDKNEDHDDYTFEPVFGGDIFAGYRFAPNWRGDIELGYMTQFSDSDNGYTFKLSTPYIMANAYYDFSGGFYLGGGVGMAFPRATVDGTIFEKGSSSETKLSFMPALMAGYSYNLSESVALDFRYRIAGFTGPKWTRSVVPGSMEDKNHVALTALETKVGLVIDNSLSLGLRYEF